MANDIKNKLKDFRQGTAEATGIISRKVKKIAADTGAVVSDRYEASGLPDKIDKFGKQAKEKIDRTGVPTAAKTVLKETSNVLDTVSGQKILDHLEERNALQDKYNDVLATKLAEALSRIEALEKLFSKVPS